MIFKDLFTCMASIFNTEWLCKMRKLKLSNDGFQYILAVFLCFGLFMCFYDGSSNSNNYIYAVEEIHAFDNTLFNNNMYTLNSFSSPRFFANQITSLMMHLLHIDWHTACLIITLFTYILYSVAVTNTIFRCFKNNRLIYSLCLMLMVAKSTTGVLGGYDTNAAATIFCGAGAAAAFLGISFVLGERRRWNAAWVVLALASILHIHEGIWGGLIVAIWWFGTTIIEKKIDFKSLRFLPIYILATLSCIIPSMLINDSVNNSLFVEIYANIRHPWHLVPSTWGNTIIVSFLLLIIPSILAVQKYFHDKSKKTAENMVLRTGSFLVLWILLLFINFVFVEVIPNASIASLYISKCFKNIFFLAMVCYLWIIDSYFKDRRLKTATFIFFFAFYTKEIFMDVIEQQTNFFTSRPIFIVVMVFVVFVFLIEKNKKKIKYFTENLQLISTMLSAFIFLIFSLIWELNYITIGVLVLSVIAYELFLVSESSIKMKLKTVIKLVLYCSLIIIILSVSTFGKLYSYENGTIKLITAKEGLIKTIGIDIYNLANDFNAKTDKDIEFFADPDDDNTGWFRLVSLRNCYQVWKAPPTSKKSVLEWYERYKKVNNFSSRTPEEIGAVMKEAGDKYILITSAYFKDYDSNPKFTVFSSTDSYRIYKLK